jgi:hypothetical protein
MSSLSLSMGMWGRGEPSSGFTPIDLSGLALWIEADDPSTLFQDGGGTSPVTADGQQVGRWNDKSGNNFFLTSPAPSRPTYRTAGGLSWIEFNGTTNFMSRLFPLNLYNNPPFSVFITVRGNPGTDRRLVSDCGDPTNPILGYVQSGAAVASSACAFFRDDANATVLNNTDPIVPNAFNNTDIVYGFVNDAETPRNVLTYVDNVANDTAQYTPSGTFTPTRFGLGALARDTVVGHFAGLVYALVVFNRILTGAERAQLTAYLGAKAGIAP